MYIRRINLFGGPGVGKSTTAARLFADIKQTGISIELVSEYIKKWVYIERLPKYWDQIYVFGKQLHAEEIVLRHGGLIITDSPILLSCVYSEADYIKYIKNIYDEFERAYPSLNIYLRRNGIEYKADARYQNEKEAVEIDGKIRSLLSGIGHYDCQAVDYKGIHELVFDRLGI